MGIRTGAGALLAAASVAISGCGSPHTDTETETESSSITSATESTTAGPVEPLCDGLDVSLVLDPLASIYDDASRAALVDYFDTLVADTGTRVRVHASPGVEEAYDSGCTDDGAIIVWGEAGVVEEEAADQLNCVMDAVSSFVAENGIPDNTFGGLMYPVLNTDGWPAEGANGIAMMLVHADDQPVPFTHNYNRPGMAAEAYIRLVGDGDDRRVDAFTMGATADRLETFTVTLGERSHHWNLDQEGGGLPEALAEWTPRSVDSCALHDEPPPPQTVLCQRLDILFVIDGSESMLEEQQALSGQGGEPPVFAEFTDALIAQLTDVEDFHLGVVSTDQGNLALHTHSGQPADPPTPETDCGLPPGQPWIVGPTDTLEEQFACLAATRSDVVEFTAANASQALIDPINEGFLRDDSLVFVVMLTDEDTYEDDPTRMETRATFLEAVGGDTNRLLVLGIAGSQGTYESPSDGCEGVYGDAKPASRLTSIVYSLRERGTMHDLCEGSLASTFNEILETVVSICTPVV